MPKRKLERFAIPYFIAMLVEILVFLVLAFFDKCSSTLEIFLIKCVHISILVDGCYI